MNKKEIIEITGWIIFGWVSCKGLNYEVCKEKGKVAKEIK